MSTIGQTIKNLLAAELDLPVSQIQDDATLIDLGLDSLSFLEMIAEFKDQFSIAISLNELSEHLKEHPIRTVGRLIQYVEELLLRETRIYGG
jgi:acyl carrier protein